MADGVGTVGVETRDKEKVNDVCVCVRTDVCMYVRVCVRTRTSVCMYTYPCVSECSCSHTCVPVRVHTCVCECTLKKAETGPREAR